MESSVQHQRHRRNFQVAAFPVAAYIPAMPDATMKPITRRYDIDTIVERVQAIVPGIQIEQLRVKHDADDDGLWFFRVAGEKGDVQLESSTYDLPFVIETSTARQPQKATTIDDAVEAVKTFFGCS